MHVVAHVLAQRPAPVALRRDVLGPGDGQRRDGLDGEPAPEVPGGIGLVELLGADLGRRRLVHPDLGVEPARGLRRALHHQVAPDLVEIVAHAVGEPGARGVQQQPRRLDRVPGHRHHRRPLEPFAAVADVVHAERPPGFPVDRDPGHHGVGPHLGAVRQRVRHVGDERGRLGVHLAALQAETPVDAVRPVTEPAVGDGHRPHPGLDAQRAGPAQEDLAVSAHRVRPVGVAVRVAPRPALPRDRQFLLDLLVVGAQLRIGQRPVGAHPVTRVGGEVARVETRGVPGVVHHRAADPAAGVVRAHRDRIGPADHPRVGPVQPVRAGLVTDPVRVRVPERARVQGRDPPARPGQPLQQYRAACPAAHDDQVDLIGVREPPHVRPEPVVGPGPVVRQQPGRLVPVAHPGHQAPSRIGSRDGRTSRTSNGSSLFTPAFL